MRCALASERGIRFDSTVLLTCLACPQPWKIIKGPNYAEAIAPEAFTAEKTHKQNLVTAACPENDEATYEEIAEEGIYEVIKGDEGSEAADSSSISSAVGRTSGLSSWDAALRSFFSLACCRRSSGPEELEEPTVCFVESELGPSEAEERWSLVDIDFVFDSASAECEAFEVEGKVASSSKPNLPDALREMTKSMPEFGDHTCFTVAHSDENRLWKYNAFYKKGVGREATKSGLLASLALANGAGFMAFAVTSGNTASCLQSPEARAQFQQEAREAILKAKAFQWKFH